MLDYLKIILPIKPVSPTPEQSLDDGEGEFLQTAKSTPTDKPLSNGVPDWKIFQYLTV